MRVAAVDCGTNSLRLLVADLVEGRAEEVVRELEVVRLGSGVDRTGLIASDAMARALRVSGRYAETCRRLGVERIRFVATSASRDAGNAGDFADGVTRAFGDYDVVPEVVTGHEEAVLSFVGATAGIGDSGALPPYLVVDLGGGSSEFVRGTDTADQVFSVDVGSVRLTERHLRHDPPTPAELAAASGDIGVALDRVADQVDLRGIGSLIGLAGTVTTVVAVALGLEEYDRDRIHLCRLPAGPVLEACERIIAMPRPERERRQGVIHPGRIDVIAAGALLWHRIVQRVLDAGGLGEVVTSEHDILDGIAMSMAKP